MQVYELSALGAPVARVTALGYFDGGHIGHRALIGEAVRLAKETGCESAVFSFSSLPTKEGAPLLTLDGRLAFFEEMGVDTVILAAFEEVRDLCAEAFVRDVLERRIGTVHAVCGFNYRFGQRASGDGTLLSRLIPASTVLPPTLYGGEPVSATRIRRALADGKIDVANAMLGTPYTVMGDVSHGKAVGRMLGFPTANVKVATALPRFGVYKTRVTVDGKEYDALSDVGIRPTAEATGEARIETFLCDFTGDLYGKRMEISFLSFLREEIRFASMEELTAQIARDLQEI